MKFSLSDEQELLRSSLERFLAHGYSLESTRRRVGQSVEATKSEWRTVGAELGLDALYVPEDHGGTGTGSVEVAVAMYAFGAALYPGPFLSSAVLATRALVHCNGARELDSLIGSGRIDALAFAEGASASFPEAIETIAEGDGTDVVVTGTKQRVLGALEADRLLVLATSGRSPDPGAAVLVAVDADAAGVSIEALPGLDPTRILARVRLRAAAGEVVARHASSAVAAALDDARIALAAEIVGAAERCLRMTVAYVCDRVQFGRPVGSFQAVKHRCADALVELETARTAAYLAAYRAREPEALVEAAAMALSVCGEVGSSIAKAAIQLHGGIGFTWEADPHLFLRRLRSSQYLLGTPREMRSRQWESTKGGSHVAPTGVAS